MTEVDEQEVSRATIDGYARLMAGILLQAALDARQTKDAALRVEAITWLASQEASDMCEVLELPDLFGAIMTGSKTPTLRRGWRVNSNSIRR